MSTPYIGQIMLVPYNFAPRGFADCDGQLLSIASYQPLFSLIGTTYGGNGTTNFQLPDLRSRVPNAPSSPWPLGYQGGVEGVTLQFNEMPSHSHTMLATQTAASAATPAGNMLAVQAPRGSQAYTPNTVATLQPDLNVMTQSGGVAPHENRQPYLGMRFVIATMPGLYPTGAQDQSYEIHEHPENAYPETQEEFSVGGDEAFIGQLGLMGFNFAPRNWAKCDGQLLPIANYSALFSLIGTSFGGDGVTTFALPDLRSRVPIGIGQGPGLSSYQLGQRGGVETVSLTEDQTPAHNHQTQQGNAAASVSAPTNALISGLQNISNGDVPSVPMANQTIGSTGGDAHSNIMPFQTINFCIALNGIYPSRN